MALVLPATVDSQAVSAIAGADLSARLYRFGKFGAAGVVACSVAGEAAQCVIASKPNAAGKGLDIWVDRKPIVECGGTVTAGDDIATDSVGRAVTATTGQYVMGKAMSDGVVGGFIPLAFKGQNLNTGGGSVAVTAAGAIPPTAALVELTATNTMALTLADGTVGHRMSIECIAVSGTPLATLTIATRHDSQPATHVFTAKGQRLELVMLTDGWKVVGKIRRGDRTVVVGTTVLTGFDLAARYNLSVTATVTGAAGSGFGIPNGQVNGEIIDVQVTTAASSPDGEIDITALDLDGAAATKIDAIDGTTSHYARFCWDGAAWQVLSITGLVTA